MSITAERRYFFLKVMKTGSETFLRHVLRNFELDEVYPCEDLDGDLELANISLELLAALPAERRARIRVYACHFPFFARELIGDDPIVFTVLREPVERTISFLKHCKRYHEQHRDLALEEIYEDEFFFPTLVRDHQTKLFSMTRDDHAGSYLDVIDIDAARLEAAKRNVEAVDVLGLQDRFGEFVREVGDRYGWRMHKGVKDQHVGEDIDVPDSFRRRIADDNRADVELYEHARAVYAARRGERVGA